MQQLTILNTRDVKRLRELVEKQFGYFPQEDYAYFKGENEKISIVSKDIVQVDFKKLIVDKIGLYFAEDMGSEIRLSKEGAQLLGREAFAKGEELCNVVDLSEEELRTYFQGQELKRDLGAEKKLVLLRYGGDIIGCAKYKEGMILNFMPKQHRGEVIV